MTLLCGCGGRWLAWAVVTAAWLGSSWGQSAASAALPTSAQAVLVEMAGHAAIIFTGEVAVITRADTLGYVDVKFRVDQPVRGVQKNGAYVLREWAGLWTGGVERYRVGQRFLMLLTARGSSGMSAPVGGMDGAIPLAAGGDSPLFGGNGDAPRDEAVGSPEPQVDLRWLAARAVRTRAGTGSSVKGGAVRTQEGRLFASGGSGAGTTVGGQMIARPITELGDGGVGGGAPGDGWGPASPLAGAGLSLIEAGTYPVATRLSSVLALLAGGGTAHVLR